MTDTNMLLGKLRALAESCAVRSDMAGRFAGLFDALDKAMTAREMAPLEWGGDDPLTDVPKIRVAFAEQRRGRVAAVAQTDEGWIVWAWRDKHGAPIDAPANAACECKAYGADPQPDSPGAWEFYPL